MYKIVRKQELNASVTLMEIEAPFVARKAKAGQFIIFRIDEMGERVPLTIAGYDREKGTVTIIFQKVGFSTNALGALKEGDYIHDFVGPLGKPTPVEGKKKSLRGRRRRGLRRWPALCQGVQGSQIRCGEVIRHGGFPPQDTAYMQGISNAIHVFQSYGIEITMLYGGIDCDEKLNDAIFEILEKKVKTVGGLALFVYLFRNNIADKYVPVLDRYMLSRERKDGQTTPIQILIALSLKHLYWSCLSHLFFSLESVKQSKPAHIYRQYYCRKQIYK